MKNLVKIAVSLGTQFGEGDATGRGAFSLNEGFG